MTQEFCPKFKIIFLSAVFWLLALLLFARAGLHRSTVVSFFGAWSFRANQELYLKLTVGSKILPKKRQPTPKKKL
jgi:hypothetical protein